MTTWNRKMFLVAIKTLMCLWYFPNPSFAAGESSVWQMLVYLHYKYLRLCDLMQTHSALDTRGGTPPW